MRVESATLRDHPFKTLACFRGGGVKNWPNLPTDSTKKLPMVGGRGQKFVKVCRRLKFILFPAQILDLTAPETC